MAKKCCVEGCKHIKYTPCHAFPKDYQRRMKWFESLQIEPVHKKLYVCYKHFRDNDYNYTSHNRTLLKTAIPSIYVREHDMNIVDEDEDEDEEDINLLLDISMIPDVSNKNIEEFHPQQSSQSCARPDSEEIDRKNLLMLQARKLYERTIKWNKNKECLRLMNKLKQKRKFIMENISDTQSECISKEQSKEQTDNKELSKEELLSLIIKCANFAAEKHRNQRRKDIDKTPYINHPLGVANLLIQEGNVFEPVVILAAILHDTVEDTDTTFAEIEKEFGHKVCQIVREVTDDKTLPKAERKRLQIEHAPNISREAKLVKLADKLYNLRDLEKSTPIGWTNDRVEEYFKWAKAVVNGCRETNSYLEKELDILFMRH